MDAEYDEGFIPSPSRYEPRDYPTFEADEETTMKTKSRDSSHGQQHHLSSWHNTLKESGITKNSKPSPIKGDYGTRHYTGNNLQNTQNLSKSRNHTKNHTIDLNSIKKQFDNLNLQMKTKYRNGSPTSDRASSVSSSGTESSDNRSLNVEIKRAKNLREYFNKNISNSKNFNDDYTNFQFSDDSMYSTHSISKPTQTQTIEIARNHSSKSKGKNTELISRLTDYSIEQAEKSSKEIRAMKNASMNTQDQYSNELLHLFNCHKQLSSEDRRIFEKNLNKEVRDHISNWNYENIMPPTYRTEETPILGSKSCGSGSDSVISEGSEAQFERVRHAESMHTLRFEKDKGRDLHALHQSASEMNFIPIHPSFARLTSDQRISGKSLPNLERFVVRPSTRDIFKPTLDIDEICGKGLRKNPRRAERIFGGSEAAKTIHGSEPTTTRSTRSLVNAEIATTVASRAKKREKSPTKLMQPPYCSSTQDINGTTYSVNAVGQQLLGTLKSLYPDWLPLGHRMIKEESEKNVAILFLDELKRQADATEKKFRDNRRNGGTTPEEYDDVTTKVNVIERICCRLEYLIAGGVHRSRVQQLKLIQSALLSC